MSSGRVLFVLVRICTGVLGAECEVNRMDRGQCCYYGMRNSRCDSKYRVEIHHIEPVSRGGKDEYENLVTLCYDHHKLIHETFFGQRFKV